MFGRINSFPIIEAEGREGKGPENWLRDLIDYGSVA